MKAHIVPYHLSFKRPAGTSRGVLRTKDTWFLVLDNGKEKGIGEINMLRGLSIDDRPNFEKQLTWLCDHISKPPAELMQALQEWPSILFGYEMALKSLQSADPFELFPSLFTQGQDDIDINGLIWMGDTDNMLHQLEEKLARGFDCIKFKIGALDFSEEIKLLASVRSRFRESEVSIRVDANGAFTPEEAKRKLDTLSQYQVHSIEQPIKAGQWKAMAELCKDTPVPIALDEELIGLFSKEHKQQCLQEIKPQYIILKPALVGGFQSCREWINLAESSSIGWWMTSALESNIGLNAIAQFTYTLGVSMPQGLGTGGLFTNNIGSPLEISDAQLRCNISKEWDTNALNF
ncbi:o-succinylbenzoate synthase [Nonlabens xiamenensis]|uniref:o-succinylbenzoate synthase n=1 Tax=Nonlabens xiamenensis TaxID=2341043 RepID=UPI000F610B87|nr:o-succinylbenzoate synthase [Nonlabens xiamenensis]